MEQLGVQLFTVRKYTKTPKQLEETLRKLHDIGYSHFELARIQFSNDEMIVLKKLKEELGLVYTTSQIKLSTIVKQFEWLVKFSKELGIDSIEVSVIPMSAFLRKEKGLFQLAKQLNELGKRLREKGLSLLYHHHDFEMIRLGDRMGIDLLIAETDSRYVNYVVDTYWLARSGVDVGRFIEMYERRISGIHLRDCQYHFNRFRFGFKDSALGDGSVNFMFLKNVHDKFLSIEQETNDPFHMLQRSRNYLLNLKERTDK